MRRSHCSITTAARALGISTQCLTHLLVRGEIKAQANYFYKTNSWEVEVSVASIHAFILRGDAK